MSQGTPSLPGAPNLRSTRDLPDFGSDPQQNSSASMVHTDNPDYANLTAAQLYELNQGLLDDAIPKRDLIGPVQHMSTLRAEYEKGSAAFVAQIDHLISLGFPGVRRSRGDGNCFYRSLAFAYVERLLRSEDSEIAAASALSILESRLPMLEAAGFEKMVYEDFYDALTSLITQVYTPPLLTSGILLKSFQSDEVSNSIVVFLRLLTSAQIKADMDTYAPFLFHPETGEPLDVIHFCQNFVEAVDKEADHVQITALSRAMRINVKVAYLDGHSADGRVEFVDFTNADSDAIGSEPLVLLYRPGHYDILEMRYS